MAYNRSVIHSTDIWLYGKIKKYLSFKKMFSVFILTVSMCIFDVSSSYYTRKFLEINYWHSISYT